MKYRVLYIVALFALILSSCRQAPEEMAAEASKLCGEYVVTATCGDPATRTSRDADGNMYWEPGDAIGVFVGWQAGRRNERGMKFTAQIDSRQATADFKGTMTETALEYWTGEGYQYYHIAMYPYQEDVWIKRADTYAFEFQDIPMSNVQEGIPGSFDPDAFVSVAVSTDDQFTFHHPMCGFKFSVQSSGVKKVTLKDPDDINKNSTTPLLYEKVYVTAKSDGTASVSGMGGTRYGELTLIPKNGTFTPGEPYYFVCTPGTHDHGIVLILEKEDGSTLTKVYDKKVTFKKGVFASLMNPEAGCQWKPAVPVVDPDTFNISQYGGQIQFNVTSGQYYEVECDAWWLVNRKTEGDPVSGICTHTFIVVRNFFEERSAVIKLKNAYGTANVTVNQEAGEVWEDYPTIKRRHCIISFGSGVAAGPMSHCNLIRDAKTHFGDEVEYFNMFLQNNYFSVPTLKERNQYHWESSSSAAVIDGRRWITIGPSSQADEVRFKDIYDYKAETDALYPPMTSIGLSSDIAGFGITVNMDVYAYQEGDYRFVVYLTRNRINMGAYMAGSFYNVACEKITEDDEDVWPYYVPGTVRHLVKGNNHLQFTTTVTGYNQPLDPANYSIFAYVLAPYGDQPVVRDKGQSNQSGDFEGSYYIDNCRLVQAGESVNYEVVQ